MKVGLAGLGEGDGCPLVPAAGQPFAPAGWMIDDGE